MPSGINFNGNQISFSDGSIQTSAGVTSNISGIIGASGVNNLIQISQANYDALATKDPNTIYFIV